MVDFMANDMKPLEVIVHSLPAPKRCLLFEPRVIAPAEFCECLRSHLLQPAQVMIQLVSSDLFSGPLAQIDSGTPLLPLLRVQITRIERRGLIAYFSCSDVREERAD